METSGQWLEKALVELSTKITTGLDLDADVISGLVSYCEMAPPLDAKEFLDNIVGQEAGKEVIQEYLKLRGHTDVNPSSQYATNSSTSNTMQAYVKRRDDPVIGAKKQQKAPKETNNSSGSVNQEIHSQPGISGSQNANKGNSKKKKSGKVVSLAEAAKGSIVFQQGKPCFCQARQHRLVSNCLSCGKIVCEQEGEGPCNFCGALVLKEGSTYAGLNEGDILVTKPESVAEAYAKRLVDYDRNSAARTTVIDDQSDYYEIEGNTWISREEKELLQKKQAKIKEEEEKMRSKVVVSFDLVGRKVLVNGEEASIARQQHPSFLHRPAGETESTRIKPNPTLKIQPVFVDPGSRETPKQNPNRKRVGKAGLCLEITGRIQHD